MKQWFLGVFALVSGCSATTNAVVPSSKLDAAIGAAIGDPTTCVLIAEQGSGKIVYRYGDNFNCLRALPACDRKTFTNARRSLALAASGRGASCASNPDASRSVGWAEGVVTGSSPALIYSAVMEGQAALPGREMNARLSQVFQGAGIAH